MSSETTARRADRTVDAVDSVDVAVVGAGFGGIAAAVRLRGLGHDVVVLEQADALGGTWQQNTYPGAGCDVPSPLYSLSFAPNPEWTRTYARQQEILEYLQRTAEAHDVTRHVRFGTRLLRGDWDEGARRWILATSAGVLRARWLVAAAGPLHRPATPTLPGLEDFRGEVFHSARWNHDHDLRARRVAVVGTGASAVQFVPEIAPLVDHLTIFQRTAQWVLPKADRTTTTLERRLFRRFPLLQRVVRLAVYAGAESVTLGVRHPRLLWPLQYLARRHLDRHVADPVLHDRLLPDHRLGCKRILISNDWYPALTRPGVTVVDGTLRRVRERSVIDDAGVEHPVDTIIFATGYRAGEPTLAPLVHDGTGRSMSAHFADTGARAMLGTAVAGFPNLFLLAGPNSFVYASLVAIIEAQVDHIAAALTVARARGSDRVEVDPVTEQAFDDELRARHERTVWTTGCRSWFVDRWGRNTAMWPGTTTELRRRLRRADPRRYRFGAAG